MSAVARWLARGRKYVYASLILGEYEGLSLRLSQGTQRDALGIVGDLLGACWYLPEDFARVAA